MTTKETLADAAGAVCVARYTLAQKEKALRDILPPCSELSDPMKFVIKTCPYCGKTFQTKQKAKRFCSDKCRETAYFKGYRKAIADGTWEARCEKRDAARKARKAALIARREKEYQANGGCTVSRSVVTVGGRRMVCETRR